MIALQPLAVRARTLATHLGASTELSLAAVFGGSPAFAAAREFPLPFVTVVGEMSLGAADVKTRIARILSATLAEARPAIDAALSRYGAERVAIVVGTCTGGLDATERAYASLVAARSDVPQAAPLNYEFGRDHVLASVRDEVSRLTGARGLTQVVSTACSSSAKAVLVAQRWIHFGLADAVVVVGVDTLCQTTLQGFASLGALSPRACRPFDVHRDGITLAEGGACLVVDGDVDRRSLVTVLGGGESSDAHHQTAPAPDGRGALAAMAGALAAAGIPSGRVVSINAHGTATMQNDASESLAIHALFGDVLVTSTKGVTGHLLGAAGLAGVVIATASLERMQTPPTASTTTPLSNVLLTGAAAVTMLEPGRDAIASNSFGFGGSNASIVLSAGTPALRAEVPPRLAVTILGHAFFSPDFESAADVDLGRKRSAVLPSYSLIPGRLRRFTSLVTQMHAEAIERALASSSATGIPPSLVPSVFGSVFGELSTAVDILDAIHEGRAVSPARFAQSVHNTPSGIFSVSTGNSCPSTTLSGSSTLLADALLEGMLQVITLGVHVVVSVADEALPLVFRQGQRPFPSHAYAVVLAPCAEMAAGRLGPLQNDPREKAPLDALAPICAFDEALRTRASALVEGLGGTFALMVSHDGERPTLSLLPRASSGALT